MGILFGKKKPGYHSGITNEGGTRAQARTGPGEHDDSRGAVATSPRTPAAPTAPDESASSELSVELDLGALQGGAAVRPSAPSHPSAPSGPVEHDVVLDASVPMPVQRLDGAATLQPQAHPGLLANTAAPKTRKERLMPLQRVVNVYALSLRLFALCRTLLVAKSWTEPVFLQMMRSATDAIDAEMRILRNHERLKDWVNPLHFRKTGSVLGAGRRLSQHWADLKEVLERLQVSGGEGFGQFEQRQLKDGVKELIQYFVQLVSCVEMVVPADFTLEVNELARTIRDVVDTASGKLNYVYDDVARICTTTAVRLSRLALWKGIQVRNAPWTRTLNDTCFTVTKATKVLRVVGQKLHDNQTDEEAFANLTALTKGIILQIRKIQEMTAADPALAQSQLTFTPDLIQEHMRAYEQGIREVHLAMERYAQSHGLDAVQEAVNNIISQLQSIKNTVQTPDNPTLAVAVASISDSVERFCGSVYFAVASVGDQNEAIKEQVMETMQSCLHCMVLLQIVSSSRSLFYTAVNPEVTMLIALRNLLLSVSVVIEAVEGLISQGLLEPSGEGTVALDPDDLNEAIIFILHFGRPLFKGDDGSMRMEESSSDSEESGPFVDAPGVQNEPSAPVAVVPVVMADPEPEPEPQVEPPSPKPVVMGVADEVLDLVDDDSEPEQPEIALHIKPFVERKQRTTHAQTSTPQPSSQPAPQPRLAPVANTPPAQESTPAVIGAGLTAEEEEVLSWNVDSYNEQNLPPYFEKAPPKPQFEKGGTEEQYKAYMVAKYEYETWENKLVLWRIKTKKRQEEIRRKMGA